MREREIESVQRAKISPLRHTEGFRARNPEDGPFGTLPIRRLGLGTRQAVSPAGDTHASTLREITANQSNSSGHPLLRLQQTIGNRHVQRAIKLARAADGDEEVTPEFEQAIQSARGSGQPLDSNVRAQMEPAFGADFSSVRVHTDNRADSLNRTVDARAFTTGRDIFFRQGEYKPGSTNGERLIAHELTHVVQQKRDVYTRKFGISQPDDACEKEAKSVEDAISPRWPDKISQSGFQIGKGAFIKRCTLTSLNVIDHQYPFMIGRDKDEEPSKKFERKRKIDEAIFHVDLAVDKMERYLPLWRNLAWELGGAYNLAWHIHEKAVITSGKKTELCQAIIFAFFTALVGGALGWIGEALVVGKVAETLSKHVTKSLLNKLAPALEDVAQAGAGEAIDIFQEYKKPEPAPCSFLPLNFQGDLFKIINIEEAKIRDIRVKLKEYLLKMKIPQQDVFKPHILKRELDDFLSHCEFSRPPNNRITKEYMQFEMERKIWALWLPTLEGMHEISYPGRGYAHVRGFDNPGTPVEKRLDELGITFNVLGYSLAHDITDIRMGSKEIN